ncbi:MAG: Hsp70 family protein [Myxococcales bacterium]|nr:Hsp70 family protein [Myxococcales bacterium]MCB9520083.1 Hsp70 family protein [Myxococcales bacterium]MCB9531809.1 Hsp70 family protein [Myxococcales bacterium]
MSGRIVGIDLGTSNTVVCAVVDGEAIVIPDNEGQKIQPSVVSFLPDGRTIVGRQAKSRMAIDPLNTIYSAKRLIGRPFYAPEINLAISKYAYQIVRGSDDNPKIFLRGRHYSIEEVQAIVLRHVKKIAENYLGEPVTRAVITVPANFNEAQRDATKTAGQLAGLEVLRILNEPTAAALAYGYDQQYRERIAVYDLGGGTFDITILELRDNVFEVLATAGDTFLGGDDFDHRVAQLIVDSFKTEFGYDMNSAPGAMQRLKAVAERVKTTLSDQPVASAMVKQMVPGHNGPSTLDFQLTRERFDQACMDIVQQTFVVCDEALKLAGLTSAEVERLVLVGGSTRIPLVREMVENYFFKQPLINVNPDEVVAVGAAIYGFGLEESYEPSEDSGYAPLTSGDYSRVSGTQSHASAPQGRAPLLIDVTPHALGVATVGGYVDVIISRNASIPTRMTRSFATSVDNQEVVRLNILEGESRVAAENRLLGELVLFDIRPAKRGEVRIDVSFEINADGMLNVTARDTVTNQIQQTRLSLAGGLSAAQVSEMMQHDLPASAF